MITLRKTPFLIILITTFIILTGCNKIDDLTKFDIEYNTDITIPSALGINLPFDLFTPPIQTNSEMEFEINDTRKDLIEFAGLTEMKLLITIPDDGDFSFLKSIDVYLSAEGLSEIRIAWKEDIQNDIGNEIILETSENDLQEYIKKDNIDLRVRTTTDKLILSDHEVDINCIFHIDAKILGV